MQRLSVSHHGNTYKKCPIHLLIAITLSIGLLINWSGHAAAVSSAGLNAYPVGKPASEHPYFTYNLSGGQQRDDTLVLANTTNVTQPVRLYTVDALLTNNGGFGMLPESSPHKDLGGWIQLPVTSLTLSPGQVVHIPFRLTIPRNVSVGAHYGGIIIQPTNISKTQITNGTNVTIIPRLGVRIYETVPGRAQPSLAITTQAARHGNNLDVTTKLQNTGNTLLSPNGTITMRNILNVVTARQPIQAGELFPPGESVTIHSRLPIQANLPQHYTLTTDIAYASGRHAVDRQSIWVAWQVFALFGTVILGIGLGAAYRSFKARQR